MKIFKHICSFIILWFILGLFYAAIEILFRGYTFIEMVWIGGLCGAIVGLLNQFSIFTARRIWQQSLFGTFVTLLIEFLSGYFYNIRLHLDLWDYSKMPFNFMGQICLSTAVGWFFLMPFAIYIDDWLRFRLFNEPRPKGGIFSNYIALFKGK